MRHIINQMSNKLPIYNLDYTTLRGPGVNVEIPESWAVVCQDNQLGFALTDHLLGLFVAQDIFATLHHQLETRVDGLHRLFLNR